MMTRMTAGPPCCGSTGTVRTTAVSVSIHENTYQDCHDDTDDCGAAVLWEYRDFEDDCCVSKYTREHLSGLS